MDSPGKDVITQGYDYDTQNERGICMILSQWTRRMLHYNQLEDMVHTRGQPFNFALMKVYFPTTITKENCYVTSVVHVCACVCVCTCAWVCVYMCVSK